MATDHGKFLGGAINEKAKTQTPVSGMALMMHLAWGLDHYPNFLAKWYARATHVPSRVR